MLDDKNVRRRFRASNYQSTTRVKPFICTMPMRLDEGWNQIQFNLSDFTRRAYGTNYIETLRVQIHANCRIRRCVPVFVRLVVRAANLARLSWNTFKKNTGSEIFEWCCAGSTSRTGCTQKMSYRPSSSSSFPCRTSKEATGQRVTDLDKFSRESAPVRAACTSERTGVLGVRSGVGHAAACVCWMLNARKLLRTRRAGRLCRAAMLCMCTCRCTHAGRHWRLAIQIYLHYTCARASALKGECHRGKHGCAVKNAGSRRLDWCTHVQAGRLSPSLAD